MNVKIEKIKSKRKAEHRIDVSKCKLLDFTPRTKFPSWRLRESNRAEFEKQNEAANIDSLIWKAVYIRSKNPRIEIYKSFDVYSAKYDYTYNNFIKIIVELEKVIIQTRIM